MYIKELTAAFGRLENDTLSLSNGLNVIHAPNEGGKSTWTTFLRVMLYGLNTRDRSPNAEKRRYMPWSGSAMQGRMDVSSPLGELTIIRRTQRANSPMGAFSAVYADTAAAVDSLSAANCGEALLGVPQEIFERSAYIRQSGIAVDHNAALERRIAALITTGEEDTSYTDAADRLRRQLNHRQSNRTTGLIPQLDQSIASAQNTLRELEASEDALQSDLQTRQSLQQRQQDILRQLALHKEADRAQAAAQANAARDAFRRAQLQMDTISEQMALFPDKEALESIRSDAAALQTLQQTAADAMKQAEAARQASAQADAPLSAHPFAGMTPEEAAQAPAGQAPRPAPSFPGILLSVLVGAALMGAVMYFTRSWLAAACIGLGVTALLLAFAVILPLRRHQRRWDAQQAKAAARRKEDAAAYTILYEAAAQAREAARTAAAAADNLTGSCQAQLSQLLSRVHPFCPGAEDLAAVLRAVEDGLRRHAAFEQAQRITDDARVRWELVADQAIDGEVPVIQRPIMSRQQLESILSDISRKLTELQRQIHTAQGRIQAVADPGQLRAQLELTQQKRDRLQAEYDAIELAGQVLAQSNTSLQNRFSPALGEKSAKIFTKLTKGKYNKVVLGKDMTPSALESGQMLPHEVATLSQGAADQLYLAVRLAICQLVLPEDDPAPILLDDALVTFDDERMAAALDYLVELAADRQILLFTCQKRELAYLAQAHPGQYHAIHLEQSL